MIYDLEKFKISVENIEKEIKILKENLKKAYEEQLMDQNIENMKKIDEVVDSIGMEGHLLGRLEDENVKKAYINMLYEFILNDENEKNIVFKNAYIKCIINNTALEEKKTYKYENMDSLGVVSDKKVGIEIKECLILDLLVLLGVDYKKSIRRYEYIVDLCSVFNIDSEKLIEISNDAKVILTENKVKRNQIWNKYKNNKFNIVGGKNFIKRNTHWEKSANSVNMANEDMEILFCGLIGERCGYKYLSRNGDYVPKYSNILTCKEYTSSLKKYEKVDGKRATVSTTKSGYIYFVEEKLKFAISSIYLYVIWSSSPRTEKEINNFIDYLKVKGMIKYTCLG